MAMPPISMPPIWVHIELKRAIRLSHHSCAFVNGPHPNGKGYIPLFIGHHFLVDLVYRNYVDYVHQTYTTIKGVIKCDTENGMVVWKKKWNASDVPHILVCRPMYIWRSDPVMIAFEMCVCVSWFSISQNETKNGVYWLLCSGFFICRWDKAMPPHDGR